jgi:hypothetical protein
LGIEKQLKDTTGERTWTSILPTLMPRCFALVTILLRLICKTYKFRGELLKLEKRHLFAAHLSCKSGAWKMAMYGYARVSTRDQDLTLQEPPRLRISYICVLLWRRCGADSLQWR